MTDATTGQENTDEGTGVSRRTLLQGLALGALGLVAGCGQQSGSAPSAAASSTANASSAAAGGQTLVAASGVPVGGGVIVDKKVVVTQPTAGSFKAFSAICTHQGCPVAEVKDGTINCACHGSRFGITDGAVKSPPADKPLAEVPVKVEGGNVVRA